MFEDATFETMGTIHTRSRNWMLATFGLNASMLAALIHSTIGARVPLRLATAASLVTLMLVTVVGLVLPNLSRSAYDGFGVSLSATPTCLCACVAALAWVALEVRSV